MTIKRLSEAGPSTPTQKLTELLKFYRDHGPVPFVKGVFGAEPTDQQIDLLNSAVQQDSRVVVKSCTASGKTTALVWLTYYFLSCYPNCKGLVTAPTSSQLNRVFRSELVLWHNRMNHIFKEMFEVMSDQVHVKGKKSTQFFSWITGSAENKESFAGLHADKVVLMVDEASALPSEIFDTLYGTLSSGDTSFILVSNPVRSEGSFYNLFQDDRNSWKKLTFTSFGSPNVDKDWIEEIKEYYGEDSDFYRMRVLGEFPFMSESQFISNEQVQGAVSRILHPSAYQNFPRILGVDVARFGSDSSVIADRQGPKLHNLLAFKGLDTVQFSQKILEYYRTANYSSVAVDGIGIGAGVVDQLKRFNLPVVDVNVSNRSSDPKTYFNLRTQLYGEVKNWLQSADIPNDSELIDDLVSINYSYNGKLQMILESKKDMKKRGKKSPDKGDAVALTHAVSTFGYTPGHRQCRPVVKPAYFWG
jgi:hypothetical protein